LTELIEEPAEASVKYFYATGRQKLKTCYGLFFKRLAISDNRRLVSFWNSRISVSRFRIRSRLIKISRTGIDKNKKIKIAD
jgi:hypothetical protein